jgi:hypothetical protein
MKVYGGVDVWIHIFLTLALVVEWLTSHAASLPPGKEPLVPTGMEVGWTQEPVWMTEKLKLFYLMGLEVDNVQVFVSSSELL